MDVTQTNENPSTPHLLMAFDGCVRNLGTQKTNFDLERMFF